MITHCLMLVLNDGILEKAASAMAEKVSVFNRLREAMRITMPERRRGLNDNGEPSASMRTIEKEVEKFCRWLGRDKQYAENCGYQ